MASANYEKAQELWHSFYQDVMYHQRYFISHPILDKLKAYGAQNEAYMSRSAEKRVRGLCFNELGVGG